MSTHSTPDSVSMKGESSYFCITCSNVPVDATLSSMLLKLLSLFGPDVRVILARKSEENDTIYIGLASSTNYTNSMVRDYVTSLFLGLGSKRMIATSSSMKQ